MSARRIPSYAPPWERLLLLWVPMWYGCACVDRSSRWWRVDWKSDGLEVSVGADDGEDWFFA